jgi:hypothetical protein
VPKKVSLPVVASAAGASRDERPTLEVARRRLGGRAEAAASGAAPPFAPGAVVEIDGRAAVVVCATARELYALFDATRMTRVPPERAVARRGPPPADLADLAGDAGVFGLLAEGERVRYQADGDTLREGTLFEKCRHGALVARADGAVIAVGFRKLWPAAGGAGAGAGAGGGDA